MSDATPITLKVGQIAFEPNQNGALSFFAAFQTLMKQPLGATEAFYLALTESKMLEAIKAYRSARLAAFKKFGTEIAPEQWTADADQHLAIVNELAPTEDSPFVTTLPAKIKLTKEMKITGEAIRLLLDLVEV